MMNAVKKRSELYDQWASLVSETLEAKLEKKKGNQEEQIKKELRVKGDGGWNQISNHENIVSMMIFMDVY